MWHQFKEWFWHWRGVAIATPSVTLGILLLRGLGLLQGWEWIAYDQLLRLRPPEPRDDRIAIVAITEEDYRRLRQIVISDQVYADVITKLHAQNPQVIALDDLRDQPVEPGHAALNEVFRTIPNVIGIEKVAGDGTFETVPPPPALLQKQQAAQAAGEALTLIGANDVLEDPDQVVRRGLVSLDGYDGQRRISFSFLAAATYLDAQGYPVALAPCPTPWWLRWWQRSDPVDGNQAPACEANWQIGETVFEPFQSHDGSYIRAEDGGYQLLINYRNGVRAFDWISISDVLEGRLPPDWARDRVVFIGAVGVTSQDLFLTPPSTSLLQSPNPMPGVEVHAQQTSQVLSAVLDDRPLMRTWSEPVEMLWIGLWAAVGAIVSWLMRYSGKTVWGYAQNFGSMTIASLTLGGLAYGAILHALWIPLIPPFLALIAAKISITAYIARTAGDIRKTFGRYLTDEVVENLLENPEGLKLGGERREITILTSDLRGFTALSERISPEEVVTILNFYLSQMADVITAYQGTIDEFMGDGILVLFGAPTTRPDDARRAVACAIAMQQAMQRVNAQMHSWDLPPLEMGIGINTGEVVVGNIGSEKRTKYGVVGSQVNLTYRIESYTTGGQILISPTTLAAAGDDIRIDAQKEVMPKGVRQPIAIYEVGGIGGEYQLYLDHAEDLFYPLTQPLEVAYTLLDGKHLGASTRPARLTKLSARGAELYLGLTNEHLAPLCNLKLNLASSEASSPQLQEDIYAKVKAMGDRACLITFTAQPPAIAKYFQQLYREVAAAAVQ